MITYYVDIHTGQVMMEVDARGIVLMIDSEYSSLDELLECDYVFNFLTYNK